MTAHDVFAYLLVQAEPWSPFQLHKLAYYCQAWSLVWDERPMFADRLEAWVGGPVLTELYSMHRGMHHLTCWEPGNPDALDQTARETVAAVLEEYLDLDPQTLSDRLRSEDPWRVARRGLEPCERGHHEITQASLRAYYGSLSWPTVHVPAEALAWLERHAAARETSATQFLAWLLTTIAADEAALAEKAGDSGAPLSLDQVNAILCRRVLQESLARTERLFGHTLQQLAE